MLKLLVTGLIIYFLYQTFFKKPALRQGQDHHLEDEADRKNRPSSSKGNDDDEYIDYEEVE